MELFNESPGVTDLSRVILRANPVIWEVWTFNWARLVSGFGELIFSWFSVVFEFFKCLGCVAMRVGVVFWGN